MAKRKTTKTKADKSARSETTTSRLSRAEYLAEVQALNRLCSLYYGDGSSPVSDLDYDRRYRALIDVESANPGWTVPHSPTRRVTGTLSEGFAKVSHTAPMLSLDNLFDDQDVTRFCDAAPEAQLYLEPKVDGLSIELRYQDGVFIQALTRGDGTTGEDVTAQARTIRNLPLQLQDTPPGLVQVRGEVYMSRGDFQRVNDELRQRGEDELANPRNAAVGALKSLNPEVTAARRLSAVLYEIVTPEHPADSCLPWARLKDWGLPSLERFGLQCANQVMVRPFLEAINTARASYPFDTDGAVLKFVSRATRERLGHNGKFPRWAAAFKFPPEEAETKLIGVTTQIGRHGTLTPVANVAPVQLGGCTVRNASLCNWDEIERLDARIGDTVVIIKAGEIIPKIVRVRTDLRDPRAPLLPIPRPTVCHCCGSPVAPDTEDAVALRCTGGDACPETRMRRLEHAVSKDALNVDGMGPGVLARLCEGDAIPALPVLMAHREEDFLEAGFSELQAGKLAKATEAAVHRGDQARVLYALSIPNIGRTASRAIIGCFGGLRPAMEATDEAIRACPDLLPVAANSFLQWCATPDAFVTLRCLEEVGFITAAAQRVLAGTTLKGQTWVITGTLSAAREVFEDMIRSHGGKVGSGVSKNTTALLAGDKAGSKLEKAGKLGIKVWTEKSFRELIGA